MAKLDVRRITALPLQLRLLEQEAVAQGFRFLTRLIDEWEAGVNRFDEPGECLMAACLDEQLVAVAGLSRDPWLDGDTGRLRRLYVADAARGRNVGRTLVGRLLEHAGQGFKVVRLSTDTSEGAAFYLRCGFLPLDDAHATHIRRLTNA